ncbi:hypothetical protein GC163_06590 [bacterium]|nr:hypothetical protein [bacterium]
MSIGQIHHQITAESELVRQTLAEHFERVEAYQYQPLAIRVRLIDEQFRLIPKLDRIDLVEPWIDQLPDPIQRQVLFVLCMADGEETQSDYHWLNREFEDPEPA